MESIPSTPASGARPAAAALSGLYDGDLDLDSLERMLLALAVHRDGAGAEAAWLLLWSPRTGRLQGWRGSVPPPSGATLDAALGLARRAAPADEERAVSAWSEEPAALEPVLAEAWRLSSLATGDAQPGTPWSRSGRVAALALRRGPRAYGLLVLAAPPEGAPGEAALEWLRASADGALAAQARASEARRRAAQAAALAEFARAAVSSINLAEGVHLLARLGAQASGLRGAAVYRSGEEAPRLEVAFGPAPLRDRFAAGWVATAAQVMASGRPQFGEAPASAADVPEVIAGEVSAWAAVPIVAYGRSLGALVAWDGIDRHPGAPGLERDEAEFILTLADVAALLLEHAASRDAARRGERRQAEQAARLGDMDRLASIAELANRVARESRNPIASITAFAKRALRDLAEDDPQREYIEVVLRESERLDAMLREQGEYARLERPRLRMQSLNAVVQAALQRWSETLVRRRVRLLKRLSSELPDLLLDEQRLRRVIENVVAFALEMVPMGGRIRIETKRTGGHVMVEIAHDGSHGAGEMLEQLFVPFAPGAFGGAAVGLGMAQQIVREHGGEIRVRGEGEWGAVFSFTLPIAGNEDRRNARDRRSVRGERRRRASDREGGEGGGV